MVICEHCSGPPGPEGKPGECCWAKATEIRKFKKLVLHKYIIEVIFDLIVSVLSVITDVISIVLYIKKGYWAIATVIAVPVLLPTLVFTNVYMADETQGYCKLPPKKGRSRIPIPAVETFSNLSSVDEDGSVIESASVSTSTPDSSAMSKKVLKRKVSDIKLKMGFHCPACRVLCRSCCGCWGGLFHSIFHKDRHLRQNGAKSVRKSLKRLSKYFFGTFVLRFIALAWYLKALTFGIRAFREPKRYLRIEKPNAHWSYDLLVRLDFLQAALENAPQCIVQLYVMLVMPDENVLLAAATLLFSFVDFLRVAISIQWDIHRGPIIAPAGCYGKIPWKILNCCSWIFLYVGRSCAIALVLGTSQMKWLICVPITILVGHIAIFAHLFSKFKSRYGVAAQKIVVSVFISIFFLPELNSNDLPTLVQFYYAVIHIQNIIFIIPWNGLDYQYCFRRINLKRPIPIPSIPTPREQGSGTSNDSFVYFAEQGTSTYGNDSFIGSKALFDSTKSNHCLIDPTIIVIMVPALTMIGIIMRLAASNKMAKFKRNLPQQEDRMVMEERVARLYRAKWSQMTVNYLASAFLKMLRKEVISKETDETFKPIGIVGDDEPTPVYFISPTLNSEFHASQSFVREAVAFLTAPANFSNKTQRSMSVDEYAIKRGRSRFGKDDNSVTHNRDGSEPWSLMELRRMRSNSHDNINLFSPEEDLILPPESSSSSENQFQRVKMNGPDGPYFLEMSWI